MVLNPYGEDTLVLCEACGYAANQQIAPTVAPAIERRGGSLPAEEVATPDATTIEALAAFLGVPRVAHRQGGVLRGRRRALRRRHRARRLRGQRDEARQRAQGDRRACGPRTVEEITARGMEPGYGSPIGARDAVVVVDELAAASPNLVAGANKPGFHLRNTNVPRDYTPDVIADIANVREGDPCPELRRRRSRSARASRSATSSSSARSTRRRSAPGTWARTASGIPWSWARTASGWAGTSRASSRRTTTRRASSGRARSRPTPRTSWRSAPRRSPRSARSRIGSTTWRHPRVRATRSCTTTATSRPA